MHTRYATPRTIALRMAQSTRKKQPQKWSPLCLRFIGAECTIGLLLFIALNVMQREQIREEHLRDAAHQIKLEQRRHLSSQTDHLQAIAFDPRTAKSLARQVRSIASNYDLPSKRADVIAAHLPGTKFTPSDTAIEVHTVSSNPPVTLIDVAIKCADGQFIEGLSRADFEVSNGDRRLRHVHIAKNFTSKAGNEIALLLDCSNSMEGGYLEAAKRVASTFSRRIANPSRLQIWHFADNVSALTPWTTDGDILTEAISPLKIDGGTALYRAIRDAAESLSHRNAPRAIVVLTDGEDTEKVITAESLTEICVKGEIAVHAIGLGKPKNGFDQLKRLAVQTGGSFHLSSTEHRLASAFEEAAKKLMVPIYRVVICEPIDPDMPLSITVGGATKTIPQSTPK